MGVRLLQSLPDYKVFGFLVRLRRCQETSTLKKTGLGNPRNTFESEEVPIRVSWHILERTLKYAMPTLS